MLQVVTVNADELDTFEQLGSKDKFWYDDRKYLFKARRKDTGEDWAEVVAALIAKELGLPFALYDLAEAINLPDPVVGEPEREPRGVRSLNFTPVDGGRLVVGNELIGPPPGTSAARAVRAAQRKLFHTAARIHRLLVSLPSLELPLGWAAPVSTMTPVGVMAGYLMLDVLIGNQDRHEENWGIVTYERRIYLAPTFDHASSLGRELMDARREIKLAHKDDRHNVVGYASKALSQLFDRKTGERLTTVSAFLDFAGYSREDALYWLRQLHRLDEKFFRQLFLLIPDSHITNIGREFAVQLLMENRKRLLALTL
ncbi:hypothetical protein B9Y88_09365 [Stenotrophomonas maltophilia]|uniref:hypothetical protein n=1 Tax=Stenotrophomonas TaxID=40323 RepID=UPI000C25B631|nr:MULTISPECIES: hypothetical protein [unclassified Stenotrophomonas]MCU1059985.1 hypothetical protein [Stenotrophomonas maltophilia]MDH1242820.1 hypothetical protein [Stenotrophomonas sp. GD03948]MDH1577303.1 hypothetical protein [Stenotrophomonas sp. GD03744]PJL78932.1 hypothetical protein B9Y88_09365 [Stenotrophomonas maltophilia]